MPDETARWIRDLSLEPHPEGGFYRETQRSSRCTTIVYLLPQGTFSAWHRIHRADEVWHHYAGDPLELLLLDGAGLRGSRSDLAWAASTRWSRRAPGRLRGLQGRASLSWAARSLRRLPSRTSSSAARSCSSSGPSTETASLPCSARVDRSLRGRAAQRSDAR